jgi:hypothetical protein
VADTNVESEAPGWLAATPPNAADVHAHLDAITATTGSVVPRDLLEESAFMGRTE